MRYVSSQWFFSPEKIEDVIEKEIKKYALLLRNKLLWKIQASKDELFISKLFKEYNLNGSSYLGAYKLDLMLKKLGVAV